MRVEIRRVRMEEGRACEMPHIVDFLRARFDVHIDRERLRVIMKKSGFLFGKKKKYLCIRESHRITKRRDQYLRLRKDCDARILARQAQYDAAMELDPYQTAVKRLVYFCGGVISVYM